MASVVRRDDDGVVTLTLARPPINVVDRATLHDLAIAIDGLANDPGARAVVLASGVDGVFCAGGDLKFWRRFPRNRGRAVSRAGRAVFDRLPRLPQPTIAAIDGQVIGDGLALALAADLRIASEVSTFRVPEAGYGFIPGWGAIEGLRALVGPAVTLEMLLTGLPIGAERARRVGLVTEVVAAGQALPRALELARLLARKSPHALAWSKKALRRAPGASARERWDEDCFAALWGGADWQEGIAALLTGRTPVFAARRGAEEGRS